jgi:PhnB protein
MPTIIPALPGGAKLVDFMKTVFDARAEVYEMPAGVVAHAEIKVGDSVVMTGEPWGDHVIPPCAVSIYVSDCDAAFARALQAGAREKEAPKNEFYGDRRARVIDPFGNQWNISQHVEDVPRDEIERRMAAWQKSQK